MCTFHYIILLIATLIILVLGNEGHMTDNVDVELKSWGVISVTELEMAKNGTHPNYHMKDVVRRCNNFELLASNKGANRLFAKAECKGIYGAPNDFKCTFINLDLCVLSLLGVLPLAELIEL